MQECGGPAFLPPEIVTIGVMTGRSQFGETVAGSPVLLNEYIGIFERLPIVWPDILVQSY